MTSAPLFFLALLLGTLATENGRAAAAWGGPFLGATDGTTPPGTTDTDASGPYDLYPSTWPSIPAQYILTNESTLSIVRDKVSLPVGGRRAVIFTTVRLGDVAAAEEEDVLSMMSNFCYHLNRAGNLLPHTMLLTTDERTWAALRGRGLPAFLDRAFPRRRDYIASVRLNDTYNREFDVQKHWWGWRLASLGFRTIYLDSDAAVIGDLFSPFSHPFGYDVQGQTDWQDLEHPELDTAFTLHVPCKLYRLRPDPTLPTGAAWTESWNVPPESYESGEFLPIVPNPCQSTGVWYLEPTPPAVAFMAALTDRIAWHQPWEWDQTAWNEVIVHFLWGAGDHEPLKYRLLPFREFGNVDAVRARANLGMPLRTIVLHMGGVHGKDKQMEYEQLRLWDGNFTWTPGMVRLGVGSSSLAAVAAAAAVGGAAGARVKTASGSKDMTKRSDPPPAEDPEKKPSEKPDQKAQDGEEPPPCQPQDDNKPSTSGRDNDDDDTPTWQGPVPSEVIDFLKQSNVLESSPHLEPFARALMVDCLGYTEWTDFEAAAIREVHENVYRHSICGRVRNAREEVEITIERGGWTGGEVPELVDAFIELCMRVPSDRLDMWIERKLARGDCILELPAPSTSSQVSQGAHSPATGCRSRQKHFEKILEKIEEDKAAGRPAKRLKDAPPESPRASLVSSLDGQILGPLEDGLSAGTAPQATLSVPIAT